MADQNMAGYYNDLPMSQLIGAPLKAASDSQIVLASAALDFMLKIGYEYDKDGKVSKDQDGNNLPRLIKFNLERPVETPDSIQVNTIKVQAPFLGLVPIPALLIEDVAIDFQMEVTATNQTSEKTAAEVSVSAGYSSIFSPVKVDVTGKVSTTRENTRSTNQTAKYQVHVNARQQPPTEGLARLMDILATCTAPLEIKAKDQPSPKPKKP